ncbi:MAG TPA: serine hydrolase [Acidobacteriota bacterium]|nr:serine hydrolase [Acidobacteriota bacterium]
MMDTVIAVTLTVLLAVTLKASLLLPAAMRLGAAKRFSHPVRAAILAGGLLASGLMLTADSALEAWRASSSAARGFCLFASHQDCPAPAVNFASYTFQAMGKFPELAKEASGPAEVQEAEEAPWSAWMLFLLWSGVATVLVARLAVRYFGLRRFLRESRTVDDPRLESLLRSLCLERNLYTAIRLRTHPTVRTPLIWGPPWASLVLPERMLGASDARLRMIFIHELEHLARRDSIFHLLGDLVAAVLWFNPLVWLTCRQMKRAQELAADSGVIESGVRPSSYSRFLLGLVRVQRPQTICIPGASAMFGQNEIEDRILSILNSRSRRRQTPARLSRAVLMIFLLMSVALGTIPVGALATPVEELGRHLGLASAHEDPWSYEKLDQILKPVFLNKMTDFYIAGAAISVVKDDKLVYLRGFGRADVFGEVAVDPERTIFRIGSVTKTMTGVAIMQLADRGKIDLEADVNRYLTKFKVDNRFEEPVRVKHLLTHVAGFDQLGYGRHVSSREEVRPLGEFLEDNLVRIRPPGQESCYDTYAITLAGYLVEEVSGLPFEEYLKRNIFQPLEMHRTNITVPQPLKRDLAIGYAFAGEWEPLRWEYMNTDPASTLNSTAADMANYARMLLNGGEFKGRRILSAEATQEMLRRQYSNHPDLPGFGYTFWEDDSYGVPAFSHGGSMRGFSCIFYLVPSRNLGVFVVDNQGTGRLTDRVVSALVRERLPDDIQKPKMRPRYQGTVDLQRFTGKYASNLYNHSRPEKGGWSPRPFQLEQDQEGNLIFRKRPAHPVGPLTFQRDDGLLLIFRQNDSGEITRLLVRQNVYEKLVD